MYAAFCIKDDTNLNKVLWELYLGVKSLRAGTFVLTDKCRREGGRGLPVLHRNTESDVIRELAWLEGMASERKSGLSAEPFWGL